jgi:hypothetical protein
LYGSMLPGPSTVAVTSSERPRQCLQPQLPKPTNQPNRETSAYPKAAEFKPW